MAPPVVKQATVTVKPVVLPPRTPAFVAEPKPAPMTFVAPVPALLECPYLGQVEPDPVLPESTLLEMQAGRETLKKHAASRAAALGGEVAAEDPPEELVKRDPTHIPNFNWTPEQQRARGV